MMVYESGTQGNRSNSTHSCEAASHSTRCYCAMRIPTVAHMQCRMTAAGCPQLRCSCWAPLAVWLSQTPGSCHWCAPRSPRPVSGASLLHLSAAWGLPSEVLALAAAVAVTCKQYKKYSVAKSLLGALCESTTLSSCVLLLAVDFDLHHMHEDAAG